MRIPAQNRGPRSIVVIGDVSGGGNYHLGDEAMTGVAIDELRDRGFDIVLVAGEPEISSSVYGVPAVPRFGFWRESSREGKLRRLSNVTSSEWAPAAADAAAQTIDAIQRADAVVIAGGGNLNSRSNENQLFDRVAAVRIARAAGVPVYVSSQTVGPDLRREDWILVREIVQYATVFGAREATTLELVRHMSGDSTPIVQTMDDAVLVRPSLAPEEARAEFELPERFAIASFTWHEWSLGVPVEEYYRRCARVVAGMIEECDVDVLLVPHMGILGAGEQKGVQNDVFAHQRIRSYVESSRVRELPILAAEDVLSITRNAEFSVSTRYHPVVFGVAAGVPAVGLSMSYYSAVRMRGALSNIGLEHLSIPFESWARSFEARILGDTQEILEQARTQIALLGPSRQDFQRAWWDSIAASISGEDAGTWGDLPPVPQTPVPETFYREIVQAQIASESVNLERANTNVVVKQLRAELLQARSKVSELERAFETLNSSVQEASAEIARLRHRLRPPGAALRDRLRRRASET